MSQKKIETSLIDKIFMVATIFAVIFSPFLGIAIVDAWIHYPGNK